MEFLYVLFEPKRDSEGNFLDKMEAVSFSPRYLSPQSWQTLKKMEVSDELNTLLSQRLLILRQISGEEESDENKEHLVLAFKGIRRAIFQKLTKLYLELGKPVQQEFVETAEA